MTADFFIANRQRLKDSAETDSFIVLTAYTQVQRGNDFAHSFEQESNFWYLCGVTAPDWRLIIDNATGEEWLVAPQATSYQTLFDGSLTPAMAMQTSGVKQVLNAREGVAKLRQLKASRACVYTLNSPSTRLYGFAPNPAQRNLNRQLAGGPRMVNIRPHIAKLRAIKQPVELQAMQRAIDTTIEGVGALLKQARSFSYDYQAEATLTYEFRRRGATHAFEPILSSGSNNCVLHYVTNGAAYGKNDWLLMDVGAKVDGYSADITRTVPLGHTTERQVAVYQAVKRVNMHAMALLNPGQNVREYVQQVDNAMAGELVSLGLLRGKTTWSKIHTYFPHAISHGLGIDPHDPLGAPEEFAENMVLTVEAGIYIPAESIGVRIEDDILITKQGAKNLSAALPIELDALTKMLY